MVVINIGDDQEEIGFDYDYDLSMVTNLRGKLEMELTQFGAAGDNEALAMFMDEYGVTELGLDKVIRLSYDLMGLQSFFTVGEDEVRAWTVQRGATAVDAAATIHSDLAKGFIRAETVAYDRPGQSWTACRRPAPPGNCARKARPTSCRTAM